jgi:hypothetical protein
MSESRRGRPAREAQLRLQAMMRGKLHSRRSVLRRPTSRFLSNMFPPVNTIRVRHLLTHQKQQPCERILPWQTPDLKRRANPKTRTDLQSQCGHSPDLENLLKQAAVSHAAGPRYMVESPVRSIGGFQLGQICRDR